MKRPAWIPLIYGLLAAASMLACVATTNAQSSPLPTVVISGKISGASGNHGIYIALWDSAGFLNRPVQEILIQPHGGGAYRFQVPPGAWAISAYEDANDNGKLDMGILGPKELSGFWRAFHGWHKPRFNEVSVTVTSDVSNADIALR